MDRVWGAASILACCPTWVATGHARGMRPGAASELPIHTILRAAPMTGMGRYAHFASACAPIFGADRWTFRLSSAILEENSSPCRCCGYESGRDYEW
jgi:hypothetical protein